MVARRWGEFVYLDTAAASGTRIVLPPAEQHHLLRVRRMTAGSAVWATDGQGTVYECRIEAGGELAVLHIHRGFGEPPSPVILLAGMLKGDGNRTIVDTAAQLGATEIRFFHGEHSEGRLHPDKIDKLHRTAIAAIKQCGRACLPTIRIAGSFETAIGTLPENCCRLLAQPLSARGSSHTPEPAAAYALAVGPEGGFSDGETQQAFECGFTALNLAPRRLRSETAVAAGLMVIAARLGECFSV